MKTDLYWFVNNLTNGNLGICPRPRGNDWLEDEMKHFKNSGVDILVSTLQFSEEYELELLKESQFCESLGIDYQPYPIEDRDLPDSRKRFYEFTKALSLELSEGMNVMIHCRQGIGRSSLLAAGVLRHLWKEPVSDIFSFIGTFRGREVPDTKEQVRWLEEWVEMLF